MSNIQLILPDGQPKTFPAGSTVQEIAEEVNNKECIAAELNGDLVDLSIRINQNSRLLFIGPDSEKGLMILRHSASHVLAQAVTCLFPGTTLGVGPAIKDGFYYDFDAPVSFTLEQLEKIEKKMYEIIAANLAFERLEVDKNTALNIFSKRNEKYKIELIQELPDAGAKTVSLYRQGDFLDLCTGPHVPSTGYLKAVKLLSVAGAYWRGDSQNKMLQRIYGTAFAFPEDLQEYLRRMEEAQKRDHRALGTQLDLFSIHEEGPGFPFIHPKGLIIWHLLEELWRKEHKKEGYQEIKTPIILSRSMWEKSGHWDHYKENMYFTNIDEREFAVKPMNCPGAMLVYKARQHSYREFPYRLAELGLVHRHELSGVLHGLLRVRAFTQDDAHIFMLPEQITEEITRIIKMTDRFYSLFEFNYKVELSTRPQKALGDIDTWERATRSLQEALEYNYTSFTINEGQGAFYGPKIDFHLEDSLGRSWQCGTIQLDFLLPEKFDLSYIGSDGMKHRPVMVHRVIFGSLERFIGILIEHYGGAFPLWLSPLQVLVIPITDAQNSYAEKLLDSLMEENIRCELDNRKEKVGYKIREAQLQKIPYMLVVGKKEEAEGTVAVRKRGFGDLGSRSFSFFQKQLLEEIKGKA